MSGLGETPATRGYSLALLLRHLTQSFKAMRRVVDEMRAARVGWRGCLLIFAIVFLLAGFETLLRETLSPSMGFESGWGRLSELELRFLIVAFMVALLTVLQAIVIALQWATFRLVGERPATLVVAIGFAAGTLPQIGLTILSVLLAVSAHAAGFGIGEGSFMDAVDYAIIALSAVYWIVALSAATAVTAPKTLLAFLIGPGLVFAALIALIWLAPAE